VVYCWVVVGTSFWVVALVETIGVCHGIHGVCSTENPPLDVCLFVWQNTHCSLHIRRAALSCEIRIDGLEGSVGPDDVTVGDC